MGRATEFLDDKIEVAKISIHALRGEGDGKFREIEATDMISIHALRGEGDGFAVKGGVSPWLISIHALRGEGDTRHSMIYYRQ